MKRVILSVLIATALSGFALADVELTLIPASGTVTGAPGSLVGWGFTINNATPDWLELGMSNFIDLPFADQGPGFVASTLEGIYADYLANPSAPIAPGQILTELWNSTSQSGVAEFLIDPAAQPGTYTAGTIDVTFERFKRNPTVHPHSDLGSSMVSAPAEVRVPEPSSLGMLMGMLLLPFSYPVWGRRILRS